MEDAALHREVRLAVAAAEAASDPEHGALMDRTDLQRVIAQLLVTLQKVERAYSEAEHDREDLSQRLTRNQIGSEWTETPQPPSA
jgi:hypothetical protein